MTPAGFGHTNFWLAGVEAPAPKKLTREMEKKLQRLENVLRGHPPMGLDFIARRLREPTDTVYGWIKTARIRGRLVYARKGSRSVPALYKLPEEPAS